MILTEEMCVHSIVGASTYSFKVSMQIPLTPLWQNGNSLTSHSVGLPPASRCAARLSLLPRFEVQNLRS